MNWWRETAVVAGVLGANSVPHLATAARRRRMLTPYGGHDSGPLANLAWGATNLVASAVLTVTSARGAVAPGLW